MATSLEVRVPLLDHEFLEWAATLPPSYRLKAREGKYLLKKAMEDRLPREVLYCEKMGFSIPLANWFRGPLRETVRRRLLTGLMVEIDIFDMALIERMLDEHSSGIRDQSAAIMDNRKSTRLKPSNYCANRTPHS